MKIFFFSLIIFSQVVIAQQSPHGKINFECAVCHSTDSWSMRKDASFNHDSTGFVLTGRHKIIRCRLCHQGLIFTKQNSNCTSCHTDIHRQELGTNCLRCHTMDAWLIVDMRQKHLGTRFPLLGKHALASCDACHTNASHHQYAATPLTCVACHKNDYEKTSNPNHVNAGFNTNCNQCHIVSASNWSNGFDHNLTSFPLTGAHKTIFCSQCHLNNKFSKLSTLCYECHSADYAHTQSPNHVTGNFSHLCQNCHTAQAWQPATFDHSTTKFALTGKHIVVTCQSCHINGNYQLTYIDCYQCHQADFQKVTNPNHLTGNFNHDCLQCHTTNGWSPASFDHSTTKFALTGKHVTVQCQACHTNGNYQLVYTDCYQCHQADFQKVTDPNHVTGNFSHNCLQCHNTSGWSPSTFNHNTTKFTLTGKHVSTTCQSCHTNGNYQLIYSDCYQCHQIEYQQSTNLDHLKANLAHDCTPCHTTSAWLPSTFDHGKTKFALTGKHVSVQCLACHTNNNYQLTYTDCYQCHQTDFQKITNPDHVAGNFNHDCLQCHTTNGWSPANFDHSTTKFNLTGKHVTVACLSCHTNNNYRLVYTDCYQCHQADYQKSTTLDHVATNLPHDCTPCHTTTAWLPSTFNHDTQFFKIYSGAHQGKWTSCSECHLNSANYLDFSCINCHTHAQSVVDPKHSGVNNYSYSSPACYSCHKRV